MRRIVLFLVLLSAAALAAAHPAPFSYLDVYLDDDGVHGAIVIHDFDAAHELNIDKPQLLLDPTVAREHRDALIRLVESRLRVVADDAPMVPEWGEVEVLAQRQSLRLPFRLARPVLGQARYRGLAVSLRRQSSNLHQHLRAGSAQAAGNSG